MQAPERLSSAWLVAVAVGLFVAGGIILAPPSEVVVSSDLTSEQEAARHLRYVAGCLDRGRSSFNGIVGRCDLFDYSRLSPEAAELARDAVSMIDAGGLLRPTHQLG